MLGKLMLAAALLLLLPIAAEAEGATETGWTRVTMPANGGFVLSLELPPGWRHSYFGDYDGYGFYEKDGEQPQALYMSFSHSDYDHAIDLRMFTHSSRLSLEDFTKSARVQTQSDTTLQAGFDQTFGRLSYSSMYSFEAGQTDPYGRYAATTFHDRVGITARVTGIWDPNSEFVQHSNRITKSITVTPVADLDADQVWQIYVSPRVTFTPGKWNLEANFSLALPPGWLAEEVVVLEAGSGDAKAGRIVVDFFPPGSSDDASFSVQMDGRLYNERLSATEFLATRDPIVASLATEAQEVKTEAGVAMPEDQFWNGWYISQDGFCLSRSRIRRFNQTQRVEAKTFAGKDSLTGEDVKLRIHTAGGVTLACNLVFRAPSDDFERLAPQVDQIVRSVKIESEGMNSFK